MMIDLLLMVIFYSKPWNNQRKHLQQWKNTVCRSVPKGGWSTNQWIGLRENLNRKPWFLPSNIGVSYGFLQFVHHPILWTKPLCVSIPGHLYPISLRSSWDWFIMIHVLFHLSLSSWIKRFYQTNCPSGYQSSTKLGLSSHLVTGCNCLGTNHIIHGL